MNPENPIGTMQCIEHAWRGLEIAWLRENRSTSTSSAKH
jgi:hypothetical protein